MTDYLKKELLNAKFGICHGSRRGQEQIWFREMLGIEVIGTESSDTAIQFPHTIEWDFHNIKDEWVGNVDFIYSNSFDHSYKPEYCLDQWMKCISPNGFCIIEWTNQSDPEHCNQLDCFGATIDEKKAMITHKYRVKNVLKRTSERRGEHILFIIKNG